MGKITINITTEKKSTRVNIDDIEKNRCNERYYPANRNYPISNELIPNLYFSLIEHHFVINPDLCSFAFLLNCNNPRPNTIQKIQWKGSLEPLFMLVERLYKGYWEAKLISKKELSVFAENIFVDEDFNPIKWYRPHTKEADQIEMRKVFAEVFGDAMPIVSKHCKFV